MNIKMLVLYLWIGVSRGEWPLLQSTNCMYLNVAHIVFLIFMCIG